MTREEKPVWLDPSSPLGSAVRYLSACSPKFNWVGIYLLKGDVLELGPYIGEPTNHKRIRVGQGVCGSAVKMDQDRNVSDVSKEANYLACSLQTRSELVVLIRHPKTHKVVGQIDIDSHTLNAFEPQDEALVRKTADQLGELWLEPENRNLH